MIFSFSKYQAAGNDFIVIDDRNLSFPSNDMEWIRQLCRPKYSIGADGIVLLQNSDVADFKMRIFNADGSEPQMCGNGLRCLCHFIHFSVLGGASFSVETPHSIFRCKILDGQVVVFQKVPLNPPLQLQHVVDGHPETVWHLNTGVPHAVVFRDDISKINLEVIGRRMRNHSLFAPEGTNVSFARLVEKNRFHVRTYERGVEAETLSCGTAAVAVALIAHFAHGIAESVEIMPLSGKRFEIDFLESKPSSKEISVRGDVNFVFNGQLER